MSINHNSTISIIITTSNNNILFNSKDDRCTYSSVNSKDDQLKNLIFKLAI